MVVDVGCTARRILRVAIFLNMVLSYRPVGWLESVIYIRDDFGQEGLARSGRFLVPVTTQSRRCSAGIISRYHTNLLRLLHTRQCLLLFLNDVSKCERLCACGAGLILLFDWHKAETSIAITALTFLSCAISMC